MKSLPTLSTFAVVAFVLAVPAFAAELENNAVKMPDSHVTRTIDCGGRDLTVTGDNDKLTVKHCSTINVVGDHNQMTAELLPASTIAALGNNNHIVFVHAPGFEVQATSSGKGNEIVPVMARDSNDVSPVKFPINPR